MGAFVRITGEEDPSDPLSLAARPKRWRIATMAAGPALNIIAAFLLLTSAYLLGLPESWFVQVSRVEPGTAAEAAGLQAGDVIRAVDNERISEGMKNLQQIIRSVPNQTVELTVWREGEIITMEATPRIHEDEDTGETYGFLGILMSDWPDRSSVRSYPLLKAINTSLGDFKTIAVAIAELPGRLIQGDVTPQEVRPTSVVGASQILTFSLQQSIEWGVAFPVLQAASLISLALGLTNLLPLPALDGGRILFVLVEAVRGRRVPPEREALVHFIGLVILIGLTALIILQDIINPILPWSWIQR
jgi:regulator of sigma E protease